MELYRYSYLELLFISGNSELISNNLEFLFHTSEVLYWKKIKNKINKNVLHIILKNTFFFGSDQTSTHNYPAREMVTLACKSVLSASKAKKIKRWNANLICL